MTITHMKFLLFTRDKCSACADTKKKLAFISEQFGPLEIEEHDIGTLDGLALGAFHDVHVAPVVVALRDNLVVWRCDGVVPRSHDILQLIDGGAMVARDSTGIANDCKGSHNPKTGQNPENMEKGQRNRK